MIRTILISLIILCSFALQAQVNIKDSARTIPMISIHTGFHMPDGDLADRFGNNLTIGGDFQLKFKNGIILGANYDFISGKDIKNKDQYFRNIMCSDGYVISGEGQFADIQLYQRGFITNLQLGYQFNILNPNPNSGPFLLVSPGILQHYVRIENPDVTTPQVNGDYKKGYDRLTNGFSLTGFAGYRFLSNSRLYNFYAGVEFTQAWTQSRRSFNYDDMARDTKKRTDMMIGIKIGWIIPLYGRVPDDYYYY